MRPERSDKNGARNAERRSPAARAAAGAMTSRSMRPRARASASVTRIASVRSASKPRPFADRTATVKWRHTDQSGVGRSMGAGSSTISSGVRRTKRDQFALRLRSDVKTICAVFIGLLPIAVPNHAYYVHLLRREHGMGSRLAAVASLIVVGTVVSAQAPNRSVIEQYKMGVAAIEAAQWQDAVEPLKAALAIDAHARTYREGPFTGEYFPQYYLFVAYLQLNDVEQA